MKIGKLYVYLKERSLNFSIVGILKAILFSDIKKIKQSDLLFIVHDNSRSAKVDNLKYAPIIDTIIDDLGSGVSNITLAAPFSKHFGKSCYGNVVMFNRPLLFAYLKKFILLRSSRIINIDSDPVIQAWKFILKKIQPKIIIGVNPSPELCIVAKGMDIYVADIQHGIIAPGNYYDLCKRYNIKQQGWPDIILCWDQFSKNFVESTIGSFVDSIVIGHPAIFSMASRKLSPLLANKVRSIEQISILVTLTSICPESHLNDLHFKKIGIPESLVNFILKNGADFNWHLRLHPAQFANSKKEVYHYLSDLFKDVLNVFWEDSNNGTLHTALSKSSVHITFNSASAREAALMGVKSGILDNDEEIVNLYFSDLIRNGLAAMINLQDISGFKTWLINCHKQKEADLGLLKSETSEMQNKFNTFINSLRKRLKDNKATRNS